MKLNMSDVFLACFFALTVHGCTNNVFDNVFSTYPKVQCVGDSSVKK